MADDDDSWETAIGDLKVEDKTAPAAAVSGILSSQGAESQGRSDAQPEPASITNADQDNSVWDADEVR